ncbi:tRNA(Ile)-lysidine synthetase [Acidiphilium cryptum JF-5]|uniref:tRNA(Ile)-lysidine synthase n=1 Tax=Acidiphilium cryptum (strain JF-5) TaxID=349163 RepID=A5FVF8_ACICJ|nr:tRNA(Ile)-lysidine synthetase [Acidiphilium cryptum JF-5]
MMAALGPFGAAPRVAVGVSGGADSMALTLLAASWARERGGDCLGLIADHGLRPESADEASLTGRRLAALGIGYRILRLQLGPGPALQARARDARHASLAAAARGAGIVHLLLGHHAGDQDELRAMRAARGPRGLAGMAGFAARDDIVILRPLLGTDPAVLREFLSGRGIGWVEDPSNADARFERVRVRATRRQAALVPPSLDADRRAAAERDVAETLARNVSLRPEGWAIVRAASLPVEALAVLFRVLGGAAYPPARAALERLTPALRPATLGGVRIMAAGRHGPGWLLVREAAACAPPVAAVRGAVWDGRFRVCDVPPGARTIGALGDSAAEIGRRSGLPGALRRTLPAFFGGDGVLSVPHLAGGPASAVVFAPQGPAAAAPFEPVPCG